MRKLLKVLNVDFNKLTREDWDNVLIVAGDEGTGKSNLCLHLKDYWNGILKGGCNESDIDDVCLNSPQFVSRLKLNMPKGSMIVYDEAGEISNLRRMSNFNTTINLAYQIIRGKNYYTVLTLPSLFDLDAFFTKRRARSLIQVYARGKYAFYNKYKLRMLLDAYQRKKNQYAAFKSVRPTFIGTFAKYSGVMSEAYRKKKERRMMEVVKILEEKLGGLENEKDMEFDVMDRANSPFDIPN